MRSIRTCSWCHTENETHSDGRPVYCHKCGHRADASRMACDCMRCMARLDDTLKPISPLQKESLS
jgi:DNA-directed RNA polymerase subunit RPC12/RpoP